MPDARRQRGPAKVTGGDFTVKSGELEVYTFAPQGNNETL